MTTPTKRILLLVLLMSLLAMTACSDQTTTTEEPISQTTQAVLESSPTTSKVSQTTAAPETTTPLEPRWSSFLDYLVDSYFHKMSKNFNVLKSDELLASLKATPQKLFIVDLRSKQDYETGHIQGAINLPWGYELPKYAHLIPQDQGIYLYSHSSVLTNQALIMLQILGINAIAIEGNFSTDTDLLGAFTDFVEREPRDLPEKIFTIDEDIREDLNTYFAVLEQKKGTDFENHTIEYALVSEFMEEHPATLTMMLDKVSVNPIPGVNETFVMKFNDHFAHELLKLDKEIPYLIYSTSPEKGGQALAAMRFMGFEVLFLINE